MPAAGTVLAGVALTCGLGVGAKALGLRIGLGRGVDKKRTEIEKTARAKKPSWRAPSDVVGRAADDHMMIMDLAQKREQK